MEHTKHLWRAGLLLLIFAGAAVAGRQVMAPDSFGEHGFYRYASVGEHMAQPVRHGSDADCAACHAEIAEAKTESYHASIDCETCHAPLATHAANGAKIAPMPMNRAPGLCALCHEQMDARPEGFPQLDIAEHIADLGVLNAGEKPPEGMCAVCHEPHGR